MKRNKNEIGLKLPFVIPEYLKGMLNWSEKFKKELELPSEQFWGLQYLRQRRAEKQAHYNTFKQIHIDAGYKYKEENGVFYCWKE